MSLKVIGSGFGRTGTKSTKDALELLGFGPCHHMYEVVADPAQVVKWQKIAAGEQVDWHDVYKGFQSQVDWPGAHVWRETMQVFPQAKVLHTVRPEEKWLKSFATTIGKMFTVFRDMPIPPHVRDMMEAADSMITQSTFHGRVTDPDVLLAAYRQRTEEVREAVPADRLLVFDVADGWEPLCEFLDVPVPDQPFPHKNLRSDFWESLGGEPS